MGSPTMPDQALAEFQLFPKLPTEVRWMIWSYVFPRRVIDIFAHKVDKWNGNDFDTIPEYLTSDFGPEPGQIIHMERIFARLYTTPLSAVNRESRSFLPQGYKHHISTDLTLPQEQTRSTDNNTAGYFDHLYPEASTAPTNRHFLVDESDAANFTKINFERDIIFFRAHDSQRSKYGIRDIGWNLEIFLGWTSEEILRSVKHLAINYDDQFFWTEAGEGKWVEPLLHFPNLEVLYVVYDYDASSPEKIAPSTYPTSKTIKQRLDWELEDWTVDIAEFAKKHLEWSYPEIKVIRNRKALLSEVQSLG